jgi:hypothetical protein
VPLPLTTALGALVGLLEIIDHSLDRWVREKLNCLPQPIPQDMATGEKEDDWRYWVPIRSAVSSPQLAELEQELGVRFSPQYRLLLQHKHFMELHVGEVGFFQHPSTGWQAILKAQIFDGWPHELLLGKGFFPFAEYSDWGLWCFSVREEASSGEYPVYLWDHDRPDEFKFVAATLEDGLRHESSGTLT